MIEKWNVIAVAACFTLVAGCSGTANLTTSALNGSGNAGEVKPSSQMDRALHIASTSARAQRCGFYFDAAQLRGQFLANEIQRGATADVAANIERAYDFTHRRISAKVNKSANYCSAARNASIKKALNVALGGNFEPPRKATKSNDGGLFGSLEPKSGREVFNPNHIYDPQMYENPTKRVDDE